MLNRSNQGRNGVRGVQLGRVGLVLAVGALSASALAVGPASATSRLVVSTATNAQFGTFLVSGTPLYTLQPSSNPCNTACQRIWPEVLLPKGVHKATAGAGVKASKLGTIKRAHGKLQVTYGGKPLYRYFADTSPSVANGNLTDSWGKWAVWVTKAPASSSTTSGSGGAGAGSGGVGF